MTWFLIASLVLFYLLAIYFVRLHNKLIKSKNKVEYAVAGVNTILKKRADLIPNIVSVVKKHMRFEDEILEKVAKLGTMEKDQIFENDTETAVLLNSILAKVKRHPELRTHASFIHLQQTLFEIEEQLSAARRTYNAHVMAFNNKLETVPSNVLAMMLSLEKKAMFEITDADKILPEIKGLFKS